MPDQAATLGLMVEYLGLTYLVTDETAYRQPTLKQLIDARGNESGYHFNPVTDWQIKPDGTVLFKPETV